MADPRVVYVVLTSGRELIAAVADESATELTLTEPLAMDSSIDEDDPTRRLVFMSRFSPYAAAPRVTVQRSAVAIIETASSLVTRYYQASLRYCERFSDERFDEGIDETIEHIEGALAETAPVRTASAVATAEVVGQQQVSPEAFDALWRHMCSAPSSNSSH